MLNPYLLMTLLYAALAILAALDSSLASFGVLPFLSGLRWFRVHFITLGVVTESIFGLLATLVAARAAQPRPATRWDIWALFNIGLLVLLIGIPLINQPLILTGGGLVFAAVVMLLVQLRGLSPSAAPAGGGSRPGRRFYVAGLSFLLLGILVGTGLWLGWGEVLRIAVPLEVHIHANNWGFMSLVFAGLLVDLYPGFAGRAMAWPRSITPIFWMMTIGALLLVLGPWTQLILFTVPGIVLHLSATGWLLLNAIKPLLGDRKAWTTGMLHLVTAYVWLVLPVLVAPLIILGVPGFPGAGVEQTAPQGLIYGWVLQFGFALVPYLFRRAFVPSQPATLGGSRLSLATVALGAIALWLSIFLKDIQPLLQGAAYALWVIALVPFALELWQIARAGLSRLEAERLAGPG